MTETTNKYQVMPPLSDEEYQALKEDIAENGVQVPVVRDAEGNIIDGHYRVRAHQELVAEGRVAGGFPTVERSGLTEDEKRDLAWRLNMQRRHLNRDQKHEAIERKLKESPEWADNRIAKLLGVDGKTVRLTRVMLEGYKKIPKVTKVVGADGKEYPRELEKTPRDLEKLKKQYKDKVANPKFAKWLAEGETLTRERIEGPLRWASSEVGDEDAEYEKRVAEMKERIRESEKRERQRQRQNHGEMFLDVDADVSKARRAIKSALEKIKDGDIPFDDEEVELLERENAALQDTARLFGAALTGDSGTDWDAELYELEQRRQWGAEREAE